MLYLQGMPGGPGEKGSQGDPGAPVILIHTLHFSYPTVQASFGRATAEYFIEY